MRKASRNGRLEPRVAVVLWSALTGTKLLALTVFAELRSKVNEETTHISHLFTIFLLLFAQLPAWQVSKYLRKRADQAARPVNDNPLGL